MNNSSASQQSNSLNRLDENAVLWGFLAGAVMGMVWWLWRVPRSGAATRAQISDAGQQLREKITPSDTVADSLAEGKAIARQHREQNNNR